MGLRTLSFKKKGSYRQYQKARLGPGDRVTYRTKKGLVYMKSRPKKIALPSKTVKTTSKKKRKTKRSKK